MTEELPLCPYCGHKMWLRKKIRDHEWNSETRKTITLYHYYIGCNTCFMRGPLTRNADDAAEAYEKLFRKLP